MKKLIFTLLFSAAYSSAADWHPITGTYAVTPKYYLDPPPDQKNNSHYRIQITGKSAKDLYNAMTTNPVKDECTGGLAKNIEEMQCLYFKNNDTYECHFSINIAKQKIEYGVVC
jgi:hypothetical protein